MKISLRKASALQESINQKLREVVLVSRVSINEFENPRTVVIASRKQLFENVAKQEALNKAFYAIRKALGKANVAVGISDNLADLAMIDKNIANLTMLADKTNLQENWTVIDGRLAKMKTATVDQSAYAYQQRQEVVSGLLEEDEVTDYKTQIDLLRKQKVKLNDEILEKNIKNEITLHEDVVHVLTENNIL